MKYLLYISVLLNLQTARAQENMHPTPPQKGTIALTGATIHVGNGTVIANGTVVIKDGKIESAGAGVTAPAGATTINVSGKHIYPGIIAASTNLGLNEVASTKSTQDYSELGELNPSVKSLVAYNTDSKIINTLRSNGILLAHIVPQGQSGAITGTSSVVQLDAWNWEDAAYKVGNGIHFNMPALISRPRGFGGGGPGGPQTSATDAVKAALARIEDIRNFFRDAKAYLAAASREEKNLKYEAVKGLFNKSQKLFIHADLVKEMMIAIDFKKEFGFDVVIVGGTDSWLIAELLKDNTIPVILSEPHSLPSTNDDAVDQPYKTGYQLQKAGVLFTICQDAGDGFWQQRCLPFQAGTMAAYGLTKEEALSAVTLNAAKILGIDNVTGSIETGKDANLVVSEGDLLDMMTSKVTHAFIQGRQIDLNNKHTQLFERYKYKYGVK